MKHRKELLDRLKNLSEEEKIERYIALIDKMGVYDYIADLEHKLYQKDIVEREYEQEITKLNKELIVKKLEIANLENEIKKLKGEK